MGVAEGGVGQQQRRLLADPLREPLGPELLEDLARAVGGRGGVVVGGGLGLGGGGVAVAAVDAGEAVDGDLGGERQELRGAVAADLEVEEVGGLVEEPGRAAAGEEIGVGDDVDQERHVRLHAPDAELLERPLHPPGGVDEPGAAGGDLHEHRVVERRDDRAGDRRAAVEPEAEAAGRAVVGDPAVIGGELVRRVLGRHPALEGEAEHADGGLVGQVDLGVGERDAARDQDLALDQVDPGDDLGDGVLDLDARVDLDEVERVRLGVDQELDGAGVLVADVPADLDGGVADRGAEGGVEVIGGGDLDDLLVPALDGAVALEEVDEVAVAVAEELDLDVLGLADELFEEDVGDAERRRPPRAGPARSPRRARRPPRRRASPGRRRPSTP